MPCRGLQLCYPRGLQKIDTVGRCELIVRVMSRRDEVKRQEEVKEAIILSLEESVRDLSPQLQILLKEQFVKKINP